MRKEIRKLIYEVLQEFKEDIGKQCIVLMGLPGAGKSTFINKEISKYIPGFTGYKVTNSDKQVLAAQYETAKTHFNWLAKNVKSQRDIDIFVKESEYKDNDGKQVKIPLTLEWWAKNNGKGLKIFYKTFYKPYYATYFDIRDLAKAKEKDLFKTKIVTAGNLLIIDTVGAKSDKMIKRLEQTKEKGYNNTIICLHVSPELAIQRDAWRKEHEGRSVGVPIIVNYAKEMSNAFHSYIAEGQKDDGVVDRLLYFKWEPAGKSPIKGTWVKKDDYRFELKRKLKKFKEQ
jgi:predicted kinase